MPRRPRFNGALRLLVYLLDVGEASFSRIRSDTGMKYETVARAVEVLKEVGFIEERIDDKPPYPRLVKLTEKGKKAAELIREFLKLAGEL